MIETKADIEDKKLIYGYEILKEAYKLVSIAKNMDIEEQVVFVNEAGVDQTISVYGYKTQTVRSNTTLDKLSQQIYGTPDYAAVLASYNGIKMERDLKAGDKIKIPMLDKNTARYRKHIYAMAKDRDGYGQDIKIDGDIGVYKKDIGYTKGMETLSQAIENRLATALNKRIRLGLYGIRANIGEPMAANAYLYSSISQTVKEDDRVDTIDEIRMENNKSAIMLEVVYTDKNGNTGTFRGAV